MVSNTHLEQSIIITGPTASGKSDLALSFAERFQGELIAMDSMTLYRGMDIGTAKPSLEEQARVPIHLIDVLDPWESGSVAWWYEQTLSHVDNILLRGKKPIIVGGTPLYLKTLLQGLFQGPGSDPELRQRLETEAESLGFAALYARLEQVDPKSARRLHPHDLRRIIRALEVFELTGKPISLWQSTWNSATFTGSSETLTIPCFCLRWPREQLISRIDKRVDLMMKSGWLDEVQRLLTLPKGLGQEAQQALGYRELIQYLQAEEGDLDKTVQQIKIRTRQFAKRQMTWFRHLPVTYLDCPQELAVLISLIEQSLNRG